MDFLLIKIKTILQHLHYQKKDAVKKTAKHAIFLQIFIIWDLPIK